MTITEERVARGVAWLDHMCWNWRETVVPEALRMMDECACICGQVFENAVRGQTGYETALNLVGHSRFGERWAVEHGFYVDRYALRDPRAGMEPPGELSATVQAAWQELEDTWLRELGYEGVRTPAARELFMAGAR